VVDLDGDGYLDILVGTGYGLFYVIDHRGKLLSCNINDWIHKQLLWVVFLYFVHIKFPDHSFLN
jgi:hypothetical protein